MLCAGEIQTTTSSIPETFYTNNYAAVCGGRSANPADLEGIRGEFEAILDLPHHAALRQELKSHGGPNGKITSLYRTFLLTGGHCPADSFEARTQTQVNSMVTALKPHMRYDVWSAYINKFTEILAPLALAADTVNPDVEQILQSARQLEIMGERAEILGDILDKRLGRHGLRLVKSTPFNPDMIIALQHDQMKALRPLITELLAKAQEYDPDGWAVDGDLSTELGELQTASKEFNNPFVFLSTLQKFMEDNPTNVKIAIGNWNYSFYRANPKLGRAYPNLSPSNPVALRQVISDIILLVSRFGNINNPAELKFSWNEQTRSLAVTFDFWISQASAWPELKDILNEVAAPFQWKHRQTSFSEETIEFPVALAEPPATGASINEFINLRDAIANQPPPPSGRASAFAPNFCLIEYMIIGASQYRPTPVNLRTNTFIGSVPFKPFFLSPIRR